MRGGQENKKRGENDIDKIHAVTARGRKKKKLRQRSQGRG